MKPALSTPLFLLLALTVGSYGCTSVDDERDHLRGALADARALTAEIQAWQRSVQPGDGDSVSSRTLEQLDSFRDRAEWLYDKMTGISADAKTGRDLRSVEIALNSLAEFEADGFEEASRDGRAAILRQFGNRAESLAKALNDAEAQESRMRRG